MHTSVFAEEAVEQLNVKSGGKYIDATVGEGGHLEKILEKGGSALGIDWDEKQIKKLEEKIKNKETLTLMVGNFADIESIAKKHDFYPADGVLFDLGLSYDQLMTAGKGLSYQRDDELLDMRLNPELNNTAEYIINNFDTDRLYEIFAKNSEEINSRTIAEALVRTRRMKHISTVGELKKVIDRVVDHSDKRTYARVFQALRMAVNKERENLEKGLKGATRILRTGGRGVVITFHSVEDRVVKSFVRQHNLRRVAVNVAKKRDLYEFERSAYLRVFEKL